MQRTLIQLKKDFQEIAEKHRQINSFFWGDFTDAISQDAVDYPLMVCTLQPTNIGENYVGVDLVVIIADKYNEQDYRVIDEVHNDSLLICKDIEVTLRQFRFSDILDLETDLTNTPFINRGHDITAGWSMNVRMEVYDYDNPCVIPYDGYDFENGGGSVGCADGFAENSDATYSTSVASGGTLILPDSQINVNSVDVGDVVSVKTIDVNLTDGTDPVTPTLSTLVGNTLTIVTPKDLEINIPYLTSDTTASITILSGSDGTITTADTTGLTTVTYEINAVAATLPLTLAAADVLTINFDAAAVDGVIKLSGTYA